nr:MAG: RNA helicase [Sanya marna-like virus 2]
MNIETRIEDAKQSVTRHLLQGNFFRWWLASLRLEKLQRSKSHPRVTMCERYERWKQRRIYVTDDNVMNLFFVVGEKRRSIQVDKDLSFGEIAYMYDLPTFGAWWSFGGRPLRMTATPRECNVPSNATIVVTGRLLGGTGYPLPLYTHIQECEQQLLAERDTDIFVLQAHQFEDYYTSLTGLLKSHSDKPSWVIEQLENLFQLFYWSRKCRTRADYAALAALAYRLYTGKSVVAKVFDIASSDLQGDFSENVARARDWFNLASSAVSNPLVEKMRKIYTYLLVQGILKNAGIEIDEEEFLSIDKRARVKYSSKSGLLMTIVDTAISIAERYDAYRVTGEWSAIVHDGVNYQQWSKKADRLVSLAPFTSNLEAHGTTYFSFIADLNDTIEKGEAIVRYARKTDMAYNGIQKKLQTLQLLKNTEVTRRASQKERKQPFGVLIHGSSSVAKSSFTKMLFYFYGKIHGLDTDDHYRYVRNPAEEYWNNFDSSKWCIQMDDIAYLLPDKSAGADPTLDELLRVCNNVPYVPSQAALEDKGKTPVMARLVVATSNAHHLNAHEYFYCPLAVRRRLPYIVHVEPKDAYKHTNGKFIDPSKLVQPEEGFPDYWRITVQKLVPIEHMDKDSASLETVAVFEDIREFLKHFGDASKEHDKIQTKAQAADDYMKNIQVCPLCYSTKSTCECLQAYAVPVIWLMPAKYCAAWLGDLLFRIVLAIVCSAVGQLAAQYWIARSMLWHFTRWYNCERQLIINGAIIGGRQHTLTWSVKQFGQVAIAIGAFYASWKMSQYVVPDVGGGTDGGSRTIRTTEKSERTSECTESADDEDVCEEEFILEGNTFGTTEHDLAKTESENVWYKNTVELSQFDVPLASQTHSVKSASEVRDMFAANCVGLELTSECGASKFRTKGVFIKGQRLVFNRHCLKVEGKYYARILSVADSGGLTANVEVSFHRDELVELPEIDLVALTVRGVPPRKDITRYWNITHIPFTHMVSVSRDQDGSTRYRELYRCSRAENMRVEALDRSMDIYLGVGSHLTQVGDCGSLGVALTPRGPVIMGFHTIGCEYTAGFPHVTQEHLRALLGDTVVAGGGKPLFSLNGGDVELLPVHPKSVTRFLKEGTANVYGMLVGGTAKARTRVCETPLQEVVCTELNYTVKHGPPVMAGWEPIYNNVKEMVRPHMDIDQRRLNHCVEMFARDIIQGLNEVHGDSWHRELVILSDRAAVNGLPGVKFIDRINMNTSMGFPWNKTKKAFIIPAPTEAQPDGIDFVPEIWERVRHIEKCYVEGRRAYPVYSAHLKDEAVAEAKIKAKKTRVFTGAPIDFSIVMRKHLLPFVRLMQLNKFIFEAGPGTVTQSIEWTHFFQYLTQHGLDRMIAGDYGKFDKRMIAQLILAAFKVIILILKQAGHDTDELKIIECLAHDVAFPVVSIKGEIMEFFGSNPSGQPLTVVVNSLVNSLYMRYAYCGVRTDGREDCEDFKQNVALMTYGDDNAMGVSHAAPWFNHTAIQRELATIGVEYTMADKQAESIPYISIDQVSFLKRTWRWEPELNAFAAPLDEESLLKSLTVWVPSRTIDKYAQMVAVVSAANSEYFFHGRALFEARRSFFQRVLAEQPYSLYVGDSTLPDWDTLCQRFRQASQEFKSVPIPGVGIGMSISLKE